MELFAIVIVGVVLWVVLSTKRANHVRKVHEGIAVTNLERMSFLLQQEIPGWEKQLRARHADELREHDKDVSLAERAAYPTDFYFPIVDELGPAWVLRQMNLPVYAARSIAKHALLPFFRRRVTPRFLEKLERESRDLDRFVGTQDLAERWCEDVDFLFDEIRRAGDRRARGAPEDDAPEA